MTNKPMLSVELRALIERLLSHDFAEECQECGIGYSDAWGELRAILDKEVDMDSDASKHHGEPVAVVDESDYGMFIEFIYGENGNSLRCGDKLYAEQPAPVAVVLPERELYMKYLVGVIPHNASEVNAYKDGWNTCLEEVVRLNGVKP